VKAGRDEVVTDVAVGEALTLTRSALSQNEKTRRGFPDGFVVNVANVPLSILVSSGLE
jgi:hypothetical protein